MEAAGAGNQGTVEFLLAQGLGVDDATNDGCTALMAAAVSGEADMVRCSSPPAPSRTGLFGATRIPARPRSISLWSTTIRRSWRC
ncbi:ankyrin repeat domain-containing protein [Actinoplanes sp. NPDC051859]|uniref:ankyrin repeat domain-containing protein n=1 Tax=Actinoplanes sp. NPDC051859 TaxID=3363909 RepID=UPI00379AF2D5